MKTMHYDVRSASHDCGVYAALSHVLHLYAIHKFFVIRVIRTIPHYPYYPIEKTTYVLIKK